MSSTVSAFPTPPRPSASSPLQVYLDLDLSPGSPIAQDLMARAEQEGRRQQLGLSSEGDPGAVSANLTPAMTAWLGAHVSGKRHAALSDIEAQARRVRSGGNKAGVVAEIEEDHLKREHNLRCTEIGQRFYQRHQPRIDDLNTLQREHDHIRSEQGDRDAVIPSRLIEFGLPLVVAIPEGFMNYGSFVALTGLGVAGFGLTVIVGLAIGLAAWFAGSVWKCWHYYMRADDEDQQQRGLRMIWIGSSTLTIALTVVGYARFRTVAEKSAREILLGLEPSDPFSSTALLLTGNLLVFFVGAAITYAILDEHPLFAKKAVALRQGRDAFDGIRRRELDGKIGEADRALRQKLTEMHRFANTVTARDDYTQIGEDFGRLKAKDSEVVGLLQGYRGALVERIEMRDPQFLFAASAADRHGGNGGGTVGLSEFTAQPLHLYRGTR